jgi:hypothetical protein
MPTMGMFRVAVAMSEVFDESFSGAKLTLSKMVFGG